MKGGNASVEHCLTQFVQAMNPHRGVLAGSVPRAEMRNQNAEGRKPKEGRNPKAEC
jgi:hypothetical protein